MDGEKDFYNTIPEILIKSYIAFKYPWLQNVFVISQRYWVT